MKYYIGIDGGGTKTAFVCYDEQETCVCSFDLPSCHILQVSKDEAISILQKGIKHIKNKIGQEHECYICAGLAGYGNNQEVRSRVEEVCASSFAGSKYKIQNDGEIAHVGALNGNDGILIIAGTGSIGLAKKQDQWLRCGGWGYLLGDEGSAYWIAKKLLQEYTMQCDGRHPRTNLVNLLLQACGLHDEYEMIPYVHTTLKGQRDQIAMLARINFELAQQQDPAALRIYEECAMEISKVIQALAHNFNDVCSVSYAGGVWKAGNYLLEPLRMLLPDGITIVEPAHSPVYGAYILARKEFSKS